MMNTMREVEIQVSELKRQHSDDLNKLQTCIGELKTKNEVLIEQISLQEPSSLRERCFSYATQLANQKIEIESLYSQSRIMREQLVETTQILKNRDSELKKQSKMCLKLQTEMSESQSLLSRQDN